jgi:hypothetical protein
MADAPGPAAKAKNPLEVLKQKVGPLPLWVWLGAGAAIWWYFQRQQSASSGSASAVPNQQTDPAGNIGSIDPATGYVYGTPEDQAALAANNAGTGGGSSGQNATTGAQTYADNNTWGIAAVNYLVGLGIDAVTANQAIQQFLSSQQLTTAEQGDVNLAIQAIGPPPSLPGPVTTSPPPVTTPGGGTTTGGGGGSGGTTNPPAAATPVVSGGHIVKISNNGAVLGWSSNGVTNTFQVKITGPGAINGRVNTVGIPQATYSGLEAGHDYSISVQPILKGKPAGKAGTIDFKTTGGTAATTGKK